VKAKGNSGSSCLGINPKKGGKEIKKGPEQYRNKSMQLLDVNGRKRGVANREGAECKQDNTLARGQLRHTKARGWAPSNKIKKRRCCKKMSSEALMV